MEKLPDIIHKSWKPLLQPLFEHESMKYLKYNVLPNCEFYPDKKNIFKVFEEDINNIKLVIPSYVPYAKKNQNTGLAFAVPETEKITLSLLEISKNFGIDFVAVNSSNYGNRNLEYLAKQGVFLLNSALTTEPNNAPSHVKYWKYFIEEVIKILASKNLIWLLMGSKVQQFKELINNHILINSTNDNDLISLFDINITNTIIECGYPTADYYSNNRGNFHNNKYKYLINKILVNKNKQLINFSI